MKSENQKAKLLYIEKYLRENTDENHPVTTPRLIEYLDSKGIKAERKSIYSDMDLLTAFGLDIEKVAGRSGGYYLASREFELAEVKLLVDLVQSSKFITEKKSRELIQKLELLVPHHEAVQLQRQVVVSDRNKAVNESIYYSVDTIYAAMSENRTVRFLYFEWDENGKQVLRKDGSYYEVSPWLLTWDDQKYYLLAYDREAQIIKHYRVDKMLHLETGKDARAGREAFEQIDVASYGRRMFGMFAGQPRTVRLAMPKSLAGVVVDRFGNDVPMRLLDEQTIAVRAEVSVSAQFFGWLAGLGAGVRIIGPDDIAAEYRNYLSSILASQ